MSGSHKQIQSATVPHLTGKSSMIQVVVSILQSDRLPQRTIGVEWNCSVSYWREFRLHLSCNLLAECERGQDENTCGYVTCRHGGFLFRNTCYVIIQPERDITHHVAPLMCKSVQGRLAIFPFESDRLALGQFIFEKHKLSLYVGIQVTMSGLPAMYELC